MSGPQQNRAGLTLEYLESRLVPDASSYVRDLYSHILERNAGDAEVSFWVSRISAGMTGQQVTQAFMASHEHHSRLAEHAFADVLHRGADDAGRNFFTNQLDNGALSVDVRVALFLSAEYQNAHADDSTFVRGLFNDILHRNADVAGQTFFETELRTGRSRATVAAELLASGERLGAAVDQLYQSYLGRTESQDDRNFWIAEGQRNRGAVERIEDDFADCRELEARHGLDDGPNHG